MKPSNRVINLLSLQLASLGLALSMVAAVADDAVPIGVKKYRLF